MKKCSKCQEFKEVDQFNLRKVSKDGLQGRCRVCEKVYNDSRKEIKTENMRIWRKNNPEKNYTTRKTYEAKNMDKILAQKREYYAETREDRIAYQTKWREANEEKMRAYRREYMREYRRTNPNYAIRHRTSNRIRELLVNGKEGRHTEEYLGCSISHLKNHLQSLFTEGMTWERFLAGEIHIDHIKPCCSFDLTKPEEQAICFHWTNLQPLWERDNLAKISSDLTIKRDQFSDSRV